MAFGSSWMPPLVCCKCGKKHEGGDVFTVSPTQKVFCFKCVEPEPEAPRRPKIVCISGSTRFLDQMAIIAWEMEKKGILVIGPHLLPANYPGVQASHQAEAEGVREILDELHLRKIDLCDEVYVVNVGGYIGRSTRDELAYAEKIGRPIRWFVPDKKPVDFK